MMHATSRTEAIERGLKKFFTGRPCKNGHTAMRYTVSGTCEQCIAEQAGKLRHNIAAGKAHTSVMLSDLHPDDARAINEFAQSLRAARKLSEGKPMPPPAPKAPRPPAAPRRGKLNDKMVLPTLKEPSGWRKHVFITADLTDDEVFDLMDLIDALRRARDPYVRPACYGLTPFERFEVALHPDDIDFVDGCVNTGGN